MMPVLVWGAPGLPEVCGDHQGVESVKVRRFRFVSFVLVAAIVGLVPMAGPALAAPATVVADLNPDTGLPPGQASNLSFSITPDSRTLSRFTLTPPSGYQLVSVDPVAGATSSITGGAVVVTGLSASPSQTTTVTFSAKTSCVDGTHSWTVDARDSQNRTYAPTGDRQSQVTGACDLAFLNDPSNTKAGELITDGDRVSASPIQVQLVNDLGSPVTHFPMAVTFVFGSDPSEGAAALTVGTDDRRERRGDLRRRDACRRGRRRARDQPGQRGRVQRLHARPSRKRAHVDHGGRLDRVRHLAGRFPLQRSELHAVPRWRRIRRPGRSGRSRC